MPPCCVDTHMLPLHHKHTTCTQIKKTCVVPFSEVQKEGPAFPIYRERNSELSAAMINLHPMDIQSSSIVRYTVTPIYDVKVVPPAAPLLLGYIVIGDLANGKASITAEAVDQLGGYAGIYYRDNSTSAWQAAAHTFSLKIAQLNGYEATDLIYDPTTAIKRNNQAKFSWPKLFQETLDNNAKSTGSVTTIGDKLDAFAMTAAPLTNFTLKANDNLPDIVFVRG
jgi:hypothetical protein